MKHRLFSAASLAALTLILSLSLASFSCVSAKSVASEAPASDQDPAEFRAPGSDSMELAGLVGPASPDPASSLKAAEADWYKDANFYHLWVASFADSDGNGLGDINGITSKLDYLKDLGVTAIWLSPFFKNASGLGNLHGYDATDMDMVDPRLGTNDDLKAMLGAAHSRGMRVIFDFVPNHVSNQHPWFLDSKAGRNDKRDWFIWSKEIPSSGWKNWGGGSSFRRGGTDSNGDSQYYYAIFWDGMPDLNYRNPEVRKAMAAVVRKWLDFGFDGTRIDAVRYLVESADGMRNGVSGIYDSTYEFFQELREDVLDPYTALGYSKFMVCENWGKDNGSFRAFMEKDGRKGFHMSLDFDFGMGVYDAVNRGTAAFSSSKGLDAYLSKTVNTLHADNLWTGTFLNNHDNYQSRPASAFGGDGAKIALATALQFTTPGMPIWYYGNELDMEGVNRGQDTQFRSKLDWTKLDALKANPTSTFSTSREFMKLRLARPSLRRGSYQSLDVGDEPAAAFIRALDKESSLVVLNLSYEPLDMELALPEGTKKLKALIGGAGSSLSASSLKLKAMPPLGYAVFALE